MRSRERELSVSYNHRLSPDLDVLHLSRPAGDARVQGGRPAGLRPLGNLDFVAKRQTAVPDEMQGERTGRRSGGRILARPCGIIIGKHSRLPAAATPREAVEATAGKQRAKYAVVRDQARHRILRLEHDVDMPQPIVVDVNR